MYGFGVAVAEKPGPDTAIAGVRVVPLGRIPDERGTIYHMLRRDDPHFIEFGEIYFTSIYRDVIKGWHRHTDMTLNYACLWGRVKLVLYDDSEGSPTRGSLIERFLGPDDYSLVVIPPLVWNGMKGMDEVSLVANCATHPHDPARTDRLDPFTDAIPYDWGVRHR
jgi:dTDP-4-dehydrorhamnose 3,5-epimerase